MDLVTHTWMEYRVLQSVSVWKQHYTHIIPVRFMALGGSVLISEQENATVGAVCALGTPRAASAGHQGWPAAFVPHSSLVCSLPATLGQFTSEKEQAEITEVHTQRERLFPFPSSPKVLVFGGELQVAEESQSQ